MRTPVRGGEVGKHYGWWSWLCARLGGTVCVTFRSPDSFLSPWRALLVASPRARHSPELGTWQWDELPQHSSALFGFKPPARCCHGTCVGRCGAPSAATARCWVCRAGAWSALPRYCLSLRGHSRCGLVSVGNRLSRLLLLPASAFGWCRPCARSWGETGDRDRAWWHRGCTACAAGDMGAAAIPVPPQPLPGESNGQQWNAGLWPVCGTPVMGQ